jgi:hypothetical protein
MKNGPEEAEMFHASLTGGQKDRHDEAKSRFS